MPTPSQWGAPAPSPETLPAPRHRAHGSPLARIREAWDALHANERLAVVATLALFLTMFFPWYSETYAALVGSAAHPTLAASQTTLSAFQAFSFAEAAVLLVCVGVLAMLYARASEQPFRLPGGDGTIVMLAGIWTALLIFYRMLEKPAVHGARGIAASAGVEWGIFLALASAIVLAVAGSRMRRALRPEAPLLRPRTIPPVTSDVIDVVAPAAPSRPRYPPAPSGPPARPFAYGRPSPPTAPTAPLRGEGVEGG